MPPAPTEVAYKQGDSVPSEWYIQTATDEGATWTEDSFVFSVDVIATDHEDYREVRRVSDIDVPSWATVRMARHWDLRATKEIRVLDTNGTWISTWG